MKHKMLTLLALLGTLFFVFNPLVSQANESATQGSSSGNKQIDLYNSTWSKGWFRLTIECNTTDKNGNLEKGHKCNTGDTALITKEEYVGHSIRKHMSLPPRYKITEVLFCRELVLGQATSDPCPKNYTGKTYASKSDLDDLNKSDKVIKTIRTEDASKSDKASIHID